jgi:hypothetical protein
MSPGGKRRGAGRPALAPAHVPEAVTIRAHPVAVARFKAHCTAQGISQRDAFERWALRLKALHK